MSEPDLAQQAEQLESPPATPTNYDDNNQSGDNNAAAEEADHFSSRWAYWLAAIGCSVGFGNVWRFPYMVYDYGGAAFFIPYVLMLILVVSPVSIMEFGLGQFNQAGLVTSFNAMCERTRGAGWGFMVSFQVLQYYPLLLAWSLIYMINSASKTLPWEVSDDQEMFCNSLGRSQCLLQPRCIVQSDGMSCGPSFTWPAEQFFNDSCNVQVDHTLGVTHFSWQVLLAWLFTWGCAFAGLAGGAKILGYMTYVTMTMPALFLLLLVGVGAAQEGSVDGIVAYIGQLDFSKLAGDVWSSALAQAIFSMGAMQGSMCGYAAHNKKDQNFVQDVAVVMLGDTMFAFLAGFAVFAIAGHLAFLNNVPIEELDLAGTSLVFQTYPVGLSQIPSPGSQILNFLFFLTLFLLGFSTVVGLSEAVILPLLDSNFVTSIGFMQNRLRLKVTGFICTVWALFGFIYATDMGKHFLDTLDEFSAEVSTLLFAYLYGVSVWLLDHENTRRKVGNTAWIVFFVLFHVTAWLGAITNIIITKLEVGDDNVNGIALGAQAVVLLIGMTIAFVVPLFLVEDQGMPMKARAYSLYIENLEKMRRLLNDTACKDCKFWRVPLTWTILIKFLIPIIASLLWLRGLTGGLFELGEMTITLENGTTKDLPAYDWYVFVVACTPLIVDVLAIVGFIYPPYMNFLLPPEESRPHMDFNEGADDASPPTPPQKSVDFQEPSPPTTAIEADEEE